MTAFFLGIWSFFANLWADTGCNIDPNGGCIALPDEGCHIDPSGGCSS